MAPSYRKIDYALRPAKHTERRMLCDIFRKLGVFNPLSNYTYVGFGGIAFSDFILFHKSLGINDMFSLEQSFGALNRLEKNKPFNAVTIVNKPSSFALPKLKWEKPHIVWLDYDEALLPSMFNDIATIANHAKSGTAVALSFQCNRAVELEDDSSDVPPLNRFITNFSRERVPTDTDETDLTGWSFGNLGGEMLVAEIDSILAIRNSRLLNGEQINFHLVCSIQYNDNAFMHTIVGVFVANKDNDVFEKGNFSGLDFLPKNKMVKIVMPKLTLREIKFLEKQLPLTAGTKLDHSHIPAEDARNFEKHYRYFPNFSVLEN